MTVKGQHMPINSFFRALAKDCHKNAIGIILSGTGSDVEIKDTTATLKIDKALPPPIKDVIQKEIEKHISGMTIKVAA